MSLIGEIADWIKVRKEVARFNKREEEIVKSRFYDSLFRLIDRELKRAYLFRNPYAICRKFHSKKGWVDPFVYGETPLSQIDIIIKNIPTHSKTKICDLGSGRGRAALFLGFHYGYQTYGVEWVKEFVELSSKVSLKHSLNQVQFIHQDITETDLKSFDVVFSFGTCFDEKTEEGLLKQFAAMQSGSYVVTISEALPLKEFQVIKELDVAYPWGMASCYIHQKTR